MDQKLLWIYGALVSALVIVLRIVWVFSATYLPWLVKPSLCPLRTSPKWARVFIVSWSGMRGAISLAAALSIPALVDGAIPFPKRDVIMFLTFCVIVTTLVLQGLSL